MMQQGSGGYAQNFKSIRKKNKNFHFGGSSRGGRRIGLLSISNLDDPRNGLKNLCTNFGNDRSHRLGGV